MNPESRGSEEFARDAKVNSSRYTQVDKFMDGGASFESDERLHITDRQLENINEERRPHEWYSEHLTSKEFDNTLSDLADAAKEVKVINHRFQQDYRAQIRASESLLRSAASGEQLDQDGQAAVENWKAIANQEPDPDRSHYKARLKVFYKSIFDTADKYGLNNPSIMYLKSVPVNELHMLQPEELVQILRDAADAKLHQADSYLGRTKQ